MNLIVDIGNTLVKCAVYDNFAPVAEHVDKRLAWRTIGGLKRRFAITQSIVSVVGKGNMLILKRLRRSTPTLFLDCQTPLPIAICYDSPQTLGSDRIALAVGANYLYPKQNVLIIDCGTAITYDLVDANAQYLGGAISPGLRMRFGSLHQATAKLPQLNFEPNFDILGRSTATCIGSGVQNGLLAELDGFINGFKKNFPDLTVLLTGGDAKKFVNWLKKPIFVVPNLLTLGLNVILEHNKLSTN